MRECGLKQKYEDLASQADLVTPRAGVWIETGLVNLRDLGRAGHSPCGSVD